MTTQEKTPEEIKTFGIMGMAGEINYERQKNQTKMEKLFEIIKNNCEETEVIEAYKITETGLPVKYEAIIGERENKKGEKKECYMSVYGKYAGAIKKGSEPPTLKAYIKYDEKRFIYDKENKVFNYTEDFVEVKGQKLKVVKD